ncbi:MAG: hypothetical protein ACI8VW_000213, partial [bacterium]
YAGALLGLDATFVVMAGLSGLGILMAIQLWPPEASEVITHNRPELKRDHPHLQEFGAHKHAHELRVDELHRH